VIGGFYIGECYCILHALSNKKDNLAEFNLADFCNSPNRQNKFYAKFSSYTVTITSWESNIQKPAACLVLKKLSKDYHHHT